MVSNFFKELLSSKGAISSMRFIAVCLTFMAFAIAIYGLYKGVDLTGLSLLCSAFITPAVMGKAYQKKIEDQK